MAIQDANARIVTILATQLKQLKKSTTHFPPICNYKKKGHLRVIAQLLSQAGMPLR